MVSKMNPKIKSGAPSTADLREIIPAFPEPQTYPSGWDVSGIVPPPAPTSAAPHRSRFAPK